MDNKIFLVYFLSEKEEEKTNILYSFEKSIDLDSLLVLLVEELNKENDNIIEKIGYLLDKWLIHRPYDFDNTRMRAFIKMYCNYKTINTDQINRIKLFLLKNSNKEFPPYKIITKQNIDIDTGRSLVNSWKLFILNKKDLTSKWLTDETSLIYMRVKPIELINLKWQKHTNDIVFVTSLQKRFDRLCFWLISMILLVKTKDEQVVIVEEVIQLGKYLYDINNFHDLGAIVAALDNPNISRLTYIWENLSTREKNWWKLIEGLYSPVLNYKNYRLHLSKIDNQLVIPYTPLHIKDIFACITNTKSDNMSLIGSMIRTFLQYQIQWHQRDIITEIGNINIKISHISEEDIEFLSDQWKESDETLTRKRSNSNPITDEISNAMTSFKSNIKKNRSIPTIVKRRKSSIGLKNLDSLQMDKIDNKKDKEAERGRATTFSSLDNYLSTNSLGTKEPRSTLEKRKSLDDLRKISDNEINKFRIVNITSPRDILNHDMIKIEINYAN